MFSDGIPTGFLKTLDHEKNGHGDALLPDEPLRKSAEIAASLRPYGLIENNLYWRLDLVYHKNSERSRTDDGQENLLILRRFAPMKHVPIRAALDLKYATKTDA